MIANGLIAPGLRQLAPLLPGGELPPRANPGLVFDRYLPIWRENEHRRIDRIKELKPALERFVERFNRRSRDGRESTALLADHHRRLQRIDEALGMEPHRFRTRWRLASGLGNHHPIENGFCFDPVLGVPMLPGSTIKGLCRQAAELLGVEERRIEALFGPESDAEQEGSGDIRFLDAHPATWPTLEVDVINCHHPTTTPGRAGKTKRRRRGRSASPVRRPRPRARYRSSS